MSYRVVHPGELEWEERPSQSGEAMRFTADLTPAAGLQQSRARLWRLNPGARGRRHIEAAQEEVFVVLEGTLSLLLGDPPERVTVDAGTIACVEPGTAIQQRNESDADVVVFVYGAPPVVSPAEHLDEVEPA